MSENVKRFKPHDCTALMRKVMMSLDGEMTEQEEKEFLADINQCSHCLDNYQIEKSFKQFLSSKLKRLSIPSSLIKDIRNKIIGSDPK